MAFEAGVCVANPRRVNAEIPCAALFYAAVLVQVIMSFAIFGLKNAEVEGLGCSGDYVLLSQCTYAAWELGSPDLCVSPSLCKDVEACRAGGSDGSLKRRLSAKASRRVQVLEDVKQRRLQGEAVDVPEDTWDFFETHYYQPVVIFACVALLGLTWLYFLQVAAKASIWGMLAANMILLAAVIIWFLVDFDTLNWPCIFAAAVLIAVCINYRNDFDDCATVMTQAMTALREHKRIFAMSAALHLIWILYFAIWVAAIVDMHFVKEVVLLDGVCQLENNSTFSGTNSMIFFIVCYYWTTCFVRHTNLMLLTANIGGWYFKELGAEGFWRHALRWALGPQSGSTALAAALTECSKFLSDRVANSWNICLSMFVPWLWPIVCLALVLRTILETFTKFGVIGTVFSGQTFCQSASESFQLLSDRLGKAVLTNFVGHQVMAWAAYMITLAAAFAAWAWADDVQGIQTFALLDWYTLLLIALLLAYFLSYPFLTLVIVVLLEEHVGGLFDPTAEIRARLNSIFASLFVGSVTMFILQAVSEIVVSAMDVVFFCFALEQKHGAKQERFQPLYTCIEKHIVLGQGVARVVPGYPVHPAGEQLPEEERSGGVAGSPTPVVGKPMPNNYVSP